MSRADSTKARLFPLYTKKTDQVAPCIRLPSSAVDILAWAVSLLNPPELRPVRKEFPYFILLDIMLRFDLLNDVVEPDEACDLH